MESLVGLGAIKTCPPSSMSSRRIMPTSAPVGCLWRSTDFTAMGSWEMFVIPQKLFFFTGTRLLGVNTPVPDLPSIFTAPAPVGQKGDVGIRIQYERCTVLVNVCDVTCVAPCGCWTSPTYEGPASAQHSTMSPAWYVTSPWLNNFIAAL